MKQAIQSALEENRYELATETLTSANGSLVRTEAMLMLRTAADQMPIPATLFIPPAVRLDLVADCDLQAVALGLQWLAANEGELAVRVALPSLRGQKFFRQLALLLTEAPAGAQAVPGNRCSRPGRMPRADRHAGAGGVGIWRAYRRARLAQQFGAVAQLHTLPLSYVKLGGGFVGGMSQSPGSQQLTASVLQTARALNIAVYAEDARRGNPAHPGRPGHQRDARSRRQPQGRQG